MAYAWVARPRALPISVPVAVAQVLVVQRVWMCLGRWSQSYLRVYPTQFCVGYARCPDVLCAGSIAAVSCPPPFSLSGFLEMLWVCFHILHSSLCSIYSATQHLHRSKLLLTLPTFLFASRFHSPFKTHVGYTLRPSEKNRRALTKANSSRALVLLHALSMSAREVHVWSGLSFYA